jgi:predicted DNA-binding transcriptional regulator YafY
VAQPKSERLMNLVICLLVARTYVPKSRIRQVVGGYGDQSAEAFERMFERDKEELRALGIPIETGSHESLFDDEPGYRIRRSEFELPPLSLEPDEAAVVGLAARVWQQAGLGATTSNALLKLRAAGVETDAQALGRVEPHVGVEDPAFWPLWQAVRDHQPVGFDYRKPSTASAEHRRLEPWSVLSWRGRWYVVGHDRDRGEARLFRLSRIVGPVRPEGRAGSYEVPPRDVVRAAATNLAPRPAERTARLLVRTGAAHGLRRRAASVAEAEPGWDRLELPFTDLVALAEDVAGHGPDVVAEAPEELRSWVVQHLKGLLAAAQGDARATQVVGSGASR